MYLVQGVLSPMGVYLVWGVSARGGVPGLGGCTWSRGVSAPRGGGCLLLRGSAPGG